MDIVIPVRVGQRNDDLRYALRSYVAHLPHERVWLVGHKPSWFRGDHIPTRQGPSKYANTTAAVRAACEHPGLSDPFLLSNDDIFAMSAQPDPLPAYHRGLITGVEAYYAKRPKGRYYHGMVATRRLLESMGYGRPLSYELHVPIVVHKAAMLEALEAGRKLPVLHKRSMYGNLAGLGGTRLRDPKVLSNAENAYNPDAEWLSTTAASFGRGAVGRHIRARFPRPCHYEGRVSRRGY